MSGANAPCVAQNDTGMIIFLEQLTHPARPGLPNPGLSEKQDWQARYSILVILPAEPLDLTIQRERLSSYLCAIQPAMFLYSI